MPQFSSRKLVVGQDLDAMQFSADAISRAEILSAGLDKQSKDKLSEMAFLTRQEIIQAMEAKVAENSDEEISTKAKYKKAFEELSKNKSFEAKLAYYKELLSRAQDTVNDGLERHQKEKELLNGNYQKYKESLKQQEDLNTQLEVVMAELFAERGHDADSMLVATRSILEKRISEIQQELKKLQEANPDTAAYLEYEKIKRYSKELEKGFAWTESRKRIVDDAVKRAMASRPLIVLMGESGVGKTALAKALSRKLTGADPEREVGGKDYRLRDLLGSRAIDEKGDYIKYGPLLRSITGADSSREAPKNSGGVYFDDEFNTRPVEVQRQILKFVAEAKPGQKITVPGTDIKVTVQPKFLYLAAGNPNNSRYDREETPVEAYREFSGTLNVDYLEQTPGNPELMEVMVAALLDQKTRRLTVASKHEIMPNFTDDSNGKASLDVAFASGGFLWRFSKAWKEILNAFTHKENVLHLQNPTQPKEKYYLQKFILDLGKVRDWLHQYKLSPNDQSKGLELYLIGKLKEELSSHSSEDSAIVKEILYTYGINLDSSTKPRLPGFTVMTPKDIGYLFPNIARPKAEEFTGEITPEPPPFDLDDEGEETPVTPLSPGKVEDFTTLPLSVTEKQKLTEMLDGYSDSVEAAKEVDPNVVIKPKNEVINGLLALGLDKLKEIAKMEKPTLLLTPNNSFLQKKANMNQKKYYPGQSNAWHWNDAESPYKAVKSLPKTVISVVEGVQHPPHIQGIASDSRFDQRRVAFEAHVIKKGMKLINPHEYAVLMQRSLKEYSKTKDAKSIVDFYNSANDTISCLDDSFLTNPSFVAYGSFHSVNRQLDFNAFNPDHTSACLRARSSVQVMEY